MDLPRVLVVTTMTYLNPVELAAVSMVSWEMRDLSEDAAETSVGLLLRRSFSHDFLASWTRDRSWKRLLFDLTTRSVVITGGKNQIDVGPALRRNNHSFDLTKYHFTPLTNLMPPRQEFHLEWLSGYIYLISNSDETEDGSDDIVRIERFNVITNKWVDLEPLKYKLKCAATAVINDQIWVIGGFNMEIRERSPHIYVLTESSDGTMKWITSDVKLLTSRSKHDCLVYRGELYVAGGYNGDFYFDTVEIYNPASRQWREGPSMVKVRRLFSLVVVEEALFAVGGDLGAHTIERLDLIANAWVLVTPVKDGRKFGSVAAHDGKIFLFGGRDHSGKPLQTWDAFDVRQLVWESDPQDHASTRARDDRAMPREHFFCGQAIVVPATDLRWE